MNAKNIRALVRAEGFLSKARGLLKEVASDEREAYGNLPESFQTSGRGVLMDEFIYSLEEAVDTLESLETAMEEARG